MQQPSFQGYGKLQTLLSFQKTFGIQKRVVKLKKCNGILNFFLSCSLTNFTYKNVLLVVFHEFLNIPFSDNRFNTIV